MSYRHDEAKKRLSFRPVKAVFGLEADGIRLAEGDEYLVLSEGQYAPVAYIPRSCVNMKLLIESETKSMCPFKGEASYYSLIDDAGHIISKDIAWSYEDPIDPANMLRGHLAFYPNKAFLTETQ